MKTYTKPYIETIRVAMQESCLGTESISGKEAGTGSSGNPVNFGKDASGDFTPVSDDNSSIWDD